MKCVIRGELLFMSTTILNYICAVSGSAGPYVPAVYTHGFIRALQWELKQQRHGLCFRLFRLQELKFPLLFVRRPCRHMPVVLYQLQDTFRHSFKMSSLFLCIHCITVLIDILFSPVLLQYLY
jgi:hypothetical protein